MRVSLYKILRIAVYRAGAFWDCTNLKTVKIGKRVKVPFRNKNYEGFILDIKNNVLENYKIKDIISVVDLEEVLNLELLKLGEYISKKTLCTKILAYQTMRHRKQI